MKKKSKVLGFSIVEAAVLLVVGAVMIASYSSLMAKKMQSDALNTTRARIDAIERAIQVYFETNGKYPCPARPSAGIDDVNFGREVMTNCVGFSSGYGDVQKNGAGTIVKGAVPVRSLDLPDEVIADAWGGRFVYAVTADLATQNTYDPNNGKITIKKKDGSNLKTNAHYVIASLGPNRRGAYTLRGYREADSQSPAPATACDASGSTANEKSNCYLNSFDFVIDLSTPAANGYDDIITYAPKGTGIVNNKIPEGIVLAFNSQNCPSDGTWEDYNEAEGRVILGRGLVTYTYVIKDTPLMTENEPIDYRTAANRKGGYAKYRLIADELPEHSHNEPTIKASASGALTDRYIFSSSGSIIPDMQTYQQGGGATYDNRQPWYALTLCRKKP